MSSRFLVRSPSGLFGFAASAVTLALLILLGSALPVVLDVRPTLAVSAALAAALLLRGRHRAGRRTLRIGLGLFAGVMSGVAAAAAYDLTLAYRTENVTFSNGAVALRGTLYLPRAGGPHPAVVLVQGSGSQPRKEYQFYARGYARRGIAALAYDKRGSGQSGGSTMTATYQDFAGDAARAVDLLRRHPAVDGRRVGIWGLSEGEWVGPLAARQADAAFLVIVSGSALTPAGQVRHETAARVRRAGFDEGAARTAWDLYDALAQFQRTGEGRDDLNRRLAEASRQPWFEAASTLDPSVPPYRRVLELPWFPAWRARMDFDALPILAELRCPVLVQVGGRDPKADGAAAIARFRAAVERNGSGDFTGILYPRAEHDVVEWRLPFHLPPPWFAAGYLDSQIDWVLRRTRRPAGGR